MTINASNESRGPGRAIALPVFAMAGGSLTASAYWPGMMTWDAIRQYGEALGGEIDDWHPPVMQWMWRRLIEVHPGPAPMLLLQLALYWGGLAILAGVFWNKGKRRLGWALLSCGLLPLGLALTGMILKDCLMAGALLVVTGLLALRDDRRSTWSGLLAGGLLCFAATLRFNAFTACLPLLIALLPRAYWCTWPRMLVTAAVAIAALIAVMPLTNRLLGAEPSGVELSLVLFDLGGITEHSGVSVFPEELEVVSPVTVNHQCYQAAKWDTYSDWVAPECPLGFTAWNDNIDAAEVKPRAVWTHAIMAHPIAYAQHRLDHFAINVRLLPVIDAVERPVPDHDAPNPWGFQTSANRLRRAVDALAMATAHTPLGWPIVWIAIAFGALIASWGLPHASLVVPVALSSIFYGCGYIVFSVASELRYHLWTEIAALIAIVIVTAECPRRRFGLAFLPASVATAAGLVVRIIV